MLDAEKTKVITISMLNRLKRNNLAMNRWMRNVRMHDNVHSVSILSKFSIQNVDGVLRTSRVRGFGA